MLTPTNTDIATQLEKPLLNLPQGDCPVYHHFGPGIYIREAHLPAGSLVVGHHHKHAHANVMLQGEMLMLGDDGKTTHIKAPFFCVSPPGRKAAFIIRDVIWQNIYATDERDVETLENQLLDKSQESLAHYENTHQQKIASHDDDRLDYQEFLSEYGLTEATARSISENPDDQIPMPDGYPKFSTRRSAIEGVGVFLTAPASINEIIAPARINGKRTPAGRFTNHSKNTNAVFVDFGDGDIFLVAKQFIPGCNGGGVGSEVTVDYRQAIKLLEEYE